MVATTSRTSRTRRDRRDGRVLSCQAGLRYCRDRPARRSAKPGTQLRRCRPPGTSRQTLRSARPCRLPQARRVRSQGRASCARLALLEALADGSERHVSGPSMFAVAILRLDPRRALGAKLRFGAPHVRVPDARGSGGQGRRSASRRRCARRLSARRDPER